MKEIILIKHYLIFVIENRRTQIINYHNIYGFNFSEFFIQVVLSSSYHFTSSGKEMHIAI